MLVARAAVLVGEQWHCIVCRQKAAPSILATSFGNNICSEEKPMLLWCFEIFPHDKNDYSLLHSFSWYYKCCVMLKFSITYFNFDFSSRMVLEIVPRCSHHPTPHRVDSVGVQSLPFLPAVAIILEYILWQMAQDLHQALNSPSEKLPMLVVDIWLWWMMYHQEHWHHPTSLVITLRTWIVFGSS